jgi:hypothetical protein
MVFVRNLKKKLFPLSFQRILNQHKIQLFDAHIVFFLLKKIRVILVFFIKLIDLKIDPSTRDTDLFYVEFHDQNGAVCNFPHFRYEHMPKLETP